MSEAEHMKFMEMAIRLSEEGQDKGEGGPFGAIVVKDGEVVGKGWNMVTAGNDPTAHAEVTAIRDACRRLGTFQLTGCVVYTSCEPCPMCLGAIYWARPDAVYYANTRDDAAKAGFDDAFIYEEIALPLAARKIPMRQLGHGQALDAFRKWHEKPDKHAY